MVDPKFINYIHQGDVSSVHYISERDAEGNLVIRDADGNITPSDIIPSEKKLLGNFLSNKTKDISKRNYYTITSEIKEFALNDDKGFPSPIYMGGKENVDIQNRDNLDKYGAEETFVTQQDISLAGLDKLDHWGKGKFLPPELGKGKNRDLTEWNGNTFLPTLNKQAVINRTTHGEPEHPATRVINGVLRTNRFSADKPYTSLFTDGDNNAVLGGMTKSATIITNGLSHYSADDPTKSTEVKMNDLKKIGMMLLLRSAGKFVEEMDNADTLDDASAMAQTEATRLTPGQAELGVQIDSSVLSPANILNKINRNYDKKPSNFTLFQGGKPRMSYGNVNNPLNPFSGTAALIGNVPTAIALVVALKTILQALSIVLNLAHAGRAISRATSFMDGDSQSTQSNVTKEFDDNFFKYVTDGLNLFFGWNGNSFLEVAKSPGYYITLCRSIIKSESSIMMEIKNNGVSSITNLLSDIDRISRSKLIGFMRVMAQMGEIKARTLDKSKPNVVDPPLNISMPDGSLIENPSMHMVTGSYDLGNGKRLTSWRTSGTPSLFLLPNSFTKGQRLMLNNGTGLKLADRTASFAATSSKNRLTADQVKIIEDKLEAEYVPFYFHDLRTNEIVSFHAFIESMSDNYNVEYEQTTGYGRIGKVGAYKNTTRSININFMIVSTNESDFNEMYVKINKLTTLIHPQWTKGRTIKIANRKFIQPFSQIPGSSPLIRIRLGDVFKSNYTRFNLARLFGLGTQDFSVNTNVQESQQVGRWTAAVAQIKNFIIAELRHSFINHPTVVIDSERREITGLQNVDYQIGDTVMVHGGVQINPVKLNPTGGAWIFDDTTNTSLTGAHAPQTGHGRATTSRTRTQTINGTFSRASVVAANTTWNGTPDCLIVNAVSNGHVVSYPVLPTDIDLTDNLLQQRAEEIARTNGFEPAVIAELTPEAIDQFFDPANNTIVKTFESTKGRGQAGFITTMNFNWKDSPWTTGFGSRAPQICKVELTFEPIYDIDPGIDSDGFNRAPIYNVGDSVEGISGANSHLNREIHNKSLIPELRPAASTANDVDALNRGRA